MKVEIEIDDALIPKGYRAVAYRRAKIGDMFLVDGIVTRLN